MVERVRRAAGAGNARAVPTSEFTSRGNAAEPQPVRFDRLLEHVPESPLAGLYEVRPGSEPNA